MAQGRTTTDHDVIRTWVERHGGRPARVKGTGDGDDPGLLRFDFGEPDDRLEPVSWEDFFEKFDENGLALVYQDEGESRFNKLVRRDGH